MADISALGGLQQVEPLDLVNYKDNRESTFQLAPKGRYTLQAPPEFPAASFSRTKRTGALSVKIDPTVVEGPHTGFTIKYTNVSATPYKRGGQTVSQLGDYLRACGVRQVINNEQQLADAAEATANSVYQADIDWRVFNTKTGFELEGMEKFPKKDDGTYQSWVIDPTDKDENGNPVRLRANLVIKRFVPSTE